MEYSFIRHWDISDNSTFALRYFGGIAVPFGNSNNIPFSESFLVEDQMTIEHGKFIN